METYYNEKDIKTNYESRTKECYNSKILEWKPILYKPSEKSFKELDKLLNGIGFFQYTINDVQYNIPILRVHNYEFSNYSLDNIEFNKQLEQKEFDNIFEKCKLIKPKTETHYSTVLLTDFDNYLQGQNVVVLKDNVVIEWWVGCDDSILKVFDNMRNKYSDCTYPTNMSLQKYTDRLNNLNFANPSKIKQISTILSVLKTAKKLKKDVDFSYDSILRDCKHVVKQLYDLGCITSNIGNRFIHKLNDEYFNSSTYLGNKGLPYKEIIDKLIEFVEKHTK